MVRQISAIPKARVNQRLFELLGANMQLTTDQAFTKLFAGTNFQITGIVTVRATGAFSVACAGGIYTATSKGGSALVAAAQSWGALTGANKIVTPTLAAIVGTDVQSAAIIYLSLTTGNSAALTANLYAYGYVLD